MIQVILSSGISALLSWSYSSSLQFIVIMEVTLMVLGVLLGLLAKPKRWLTIALASLAAIGLLVVLKAHFIGLSSDWYIAVPFIAEAVCVGAVASLIVFAIRRTRT